MADRLDLRKRALEVLELSQRNQEVSKTLDIDRKTPYS